jgi:methanogenic corrinoid protein MtbC1
LRTFITSAGRKQARQDYVVLVGGAPLNEAFANSIGADSYCRDAVAVETAKQYMAKGQGSALAARA